MYRHHTLKLPNLYRGFSRALKFAINKPLYVKQTLIASESISLHIKKSKLYKKSLLLTAIV